MERDSDDGTNPFFVKSTNPFDEDDIDDDTFLRPSTSKFAFKPHSKNTIATDVAQGDVDLDERKCQVQSRTLASTQRSLGLLLESQSVGEKAAQELGEQRDQLENCVRKADEINANLRNSQKHLRRIKSFFGGVKDFLMGVKIKPVKPSNKCKTSDEFSSNSTNRSAGQPHRSRSTTLKQTASSHPGLRTSCSDGDKLTPKVVEEAIDKNLGQMLDNVVCLKGLAVDLGEELDHQNVLIDSLNDKSEEAQMSLAKQNRDIAKLLK